MKTEKKSPRISLPPGWPHAVQSAMLHVISLAQFALTHARGWAVKSPIARVRLKAENDRLRQEVACLNEVIGIKDARMERVDPQKRPHYSSTERMAILELRAAHNWSTQQTADTFLVTPATIASWMKRLDEQGPDAFVQVREPVNKFPNFVRYAVQRLKTLCPTLGKVKMAKILCRAGLHLGSTTVGRILKEAPHLATPNSAEASGRVVTAKKPNHVWHIDLTTVPIGGGFWVPWLPFALPQCWPFAWWLAVIIDHYSRRAMGVALYAKPPTSLAIRAFLGRTISDTKVMPNHFICDKGSIFWCADFKQWCQSKAIRVRFGAVGKDGSIAVVERFIRTLKDESTRRTMVPRRREVFRNELTSYFDWYNEHRPHATLGDMTPNEVYFHLQPANRTPQTLASECAMCRTSDNHRRTTGRSLHTRRQLPGRQTKSTGRIAETRGVKYCSSYVLAPSVRLDAGLVRNILQFRLTNRHLSLCHTLRQRILTAYGIKIRPNVSGIRTIRPNQNDGLIFDLSMSQIIVDNSQSNHSRNISRVISSGHKSESRIQPLSCS